MLNKEVSKLKSIFKKNKNQTFIIDAINNYRFRYKDIEILSLKLASFLARSGIKKGDKLVTFLPNCPEFIVIYFACMQIGAIPVPISTKLKEEEIDYILSKSEAKAFFSHDSLEKSFKKCLKALPRLKIFIFELGPKNYSSQKGRNIEDFTFFKKIAKEKLYTAQPFQKINDKDIAIIIFTSGTTSRPKGVVISYGKILKNGSVFLDTLGIKQSLRFYGIMSLSYLGGFYNLMLLPCLTGGSIVLDNVFDINVAINFWRKVIKYKINALWLVPSMISVLLIRGRSAEGANYCKNNIKIVLAGTAPLMPLLKKKFEKWFSLKLYENYALSETFFITTASPRFSQNKGVGKTIPGCKVSIMGEKGFNCQPGQSGEIVVKTPFLMEGYYKNKKEEKKSIKDGKIYTGDIGYIDKDGFLYITDRKKDIIIRGGINISPAEIEEVILNHSLVKNVAVVGISSKLYGEEIVAVIEAQPGVKEENIIQHCRNHLALFKVPRRVMFVKKLPRSATGKIQKNKIRDNILRKEKSYD